MHIGICDTDSGAVSLTFISACRLPAILPTKRNKTNNKADHFNTALEETHRQIAGREGSGRSKLANIRIEEHSGAGTKKQCKYKKGSVNLTSQLHGLTDQELAKLIASHLKGTAKDSADIMEVEDTGRPLSLQNILQILDQAHGKLHEPFDEACAVWDLAARRNWKSVREWIVYLKRTMTRTWWSRTSRRLPQCVGCFGAREEVTGAVQLWRSGAVPPVMFPKTHEMEQITGQPYPSTNRASRPKTLMGEPSARKVYETEVESEQEQDTVEEVDVLEVELPVDEDELVEDTARGDREVPCAAEAAFFAWLACQAQTGGYQDGKGLTENLVESEYRFWSQGSCCCSR